ncbi:uncharacterized protein PHALS_07127 [Plasmopara halstedii]|uniref:Uncharacterized protein n=1 Tax=Plasmopara halstedii TaxID=4781 RepID=A0A0P1B4Q4_PLAHL|nr:uncharacterized protein PHALS_07127 [Plasmopara halstedii]CEG49362.1 hypothetical protein PHALS_07127 [Plasmopara halstedii]|eukprot:XP_024585731.1 hypothetical protein PHALS_07127 [Plasmopara halstedii]
MRRIGPDNDILFCCGTRSDGDWIGNHKARRGTIKVQISSIKTRKYISVSSWRTHRCSCVPALFFKWLFESKLMLTGTDVALQALCCHVVKNNSTQLRKCNIDIMEFDEHSLCILSTSSCKLTEKQKLCMLKIGCA